MNRRFSTLILAACWATLLPAQPSSALRSVPPPTDIESELARLPPSDHIDFLLAKAYEFEGNDLDRSLALINRAGSIAQTPAERWRVTYREQINVMRRGQYREGLTMARRLLENARDIGDASMRLKSEFAIAHALRLQGNFPEALQGFEQALQIGSALTGVESDIARIIGSIALIYLDQKNLEEALLYATRARDIALTLPQTFPRCWVLNAYGVILTELGRYDEAVVAHREAMAIRQTDFNRVGVANSLLNLGQIDQRLGRLDSAIVAIREALSVYVEHNARGNQLTARELLADMFLARGEIAAAHEQIEACAPVVSILGDQTHELEYYRLKALLLEAQGQPAEALHFVWSYTDLRDKIAGESIKRSLAKLQSQAEIARRDANIAELERDHVIAQGALEHTTGQLSRIRTFYLSIGVSLLAMVIALILVLRARSRADRRILRETETARHAAEKANELKTRLLAIASHDLKSPLRAVEAAAEHMESFPQETQTVTKYSGSIRAQAHRMFGLISDLIDQSAITSGSLQLMRAPTAVENLLRQAVVRHQPTAQAKQISLSIQTTPAAASVTASLDRARFDQVLDNLIDNAIKFSPPESEIDVDLQTDETAIRITIRDHGPGFSTKDLATAFQPFQTLSALPTAGEKSSGLGLHIAREIVSRHGGQLSIESFPGEGAELTIRLPRLHETNTETPPR